MALVARTSHHNMQQRLAESALSSLQFGTLRTLDFDGSQTLSELSRKFVLDPSTLVPVVDALERKGFISRERDPQDRRRFPLSATEEGRQVLQKIDVIADDAPLLKSLDKLSDEDRDTFLSLTRQLVRNLPDGEDMLENVQSRIYSCHKTEEKHDAGDC